MSETLSGPPLIGRLVIIGVGLIGGSFALALKSRGLVGEVVGLGRTRPVLEEALTLGVIDRIAVDPADALKGADLALVAVPVAQTRRVLASLASYLEPHTVLTDGGSTKQDVVEMAREVLGARIPQFVPAHPIAGAERSGPSAASASLYQARKVVITALPETRPEAVALVRQSWEACGAQIREMTPARHDAVFAAVSHLPHLLSFALVHQLAGRADADLLFDYAASGFRDFTRIASSHPEMWRDICVANRDAIRAELRAYQSELEALDRMLETGDAAALETVFTRSRDTRDAWLDRQK